MITPYDHEKAIRSFAKDTRRLGGKLPKGLQAKAAELFEQYYKVAMEGDKRIPTMKRPAVTAACVYVAAGQMKYRLLQSDLAMLFEVSEPTLRKAALWILAEIIEDESGKGVGSWVSAKTRSK